MKIAVIGAGNVGKTIGHGWVKAGHEVMFGVRDHHSDKTKKLLAEMSGKGRAAAGSNETAAQWAEVVVFTTPWNVTKQAVEQCGELNGKIVIDATNPVKLGATDEMLELGFDDSAGERVAQWASGGHVYKSLNQVGWEIMADPILEGRKAAMFFAGPDREEKSDVEGLIADLEFEPLYVGDIKMARILEPLGMNWIHAAIEMGMGREWALTVVRR